MRGYAAPAVQSDHRRAEELATRLGARPEVLPSLIAIWSYWLVHGDGAPPAGSSSGSRAWSVARLRLVRAGGRRLRRLAGVLRRQPAHRPGPT